MSDGSDLADELAGIEPRTIVTLEGAHEGDWHVNKAASVGGTGRNTAENRAIVLQRSDASAEWLSFAITDKSGEWEILTADRHGEAEEPEPIDPDEITIV